MPKLKETYQQIQERNAREIKQRTDRRIKAILKQEEEPEFVVDELPEHSVAKADSTIVLNLVCLIILLFVIILLLVQQLFFAERY